jgi:stalled ribosome alternative rescue factor ArfA
MKTPPRPRFVQFRYKLIRRLPVPRLKQIEMERNLDNAVFRHKLEAARAGKESLDRIESIHRDHWYETDMRNEEEEHIRSNEIIAQARRLDLPVPIMPSDIDDDDDWQTGQYFYRATLSRTGRHRLREAIRKEKKERHEGWTRWLQWLTPVIAIGGIFATILTRK